MRTVRLLIPPTYNCLNFLIGVNIDLNVQQDLEPDAPVTLLTSGILYSSVSWGIDNDGRPLAPPSKSHGKLSGQRYGHFCNVYTHKGLF